MRIEKLFWQMEVQSRESHLRRTQIQETEGGKGDNDSGKALPTSVFPRTDHSDASVFLANNKFSPATGKEPSRLAQSSYIAGPSHCPGHKAPRG